MGEINSALVFRSATEDYRIRETWVANRMREFGWGPRTTSKLNECTSDLRISFPVGLQPL